MSSSSLWHDIKSNPVALIAAIGLHVVLITLLSMNLVSSEVHIPQRAQQKTVQAVVVDAAQIDKEIEKLKQADKKEQQKLQKEKDKVKQQIAAEKKRLADLKKKKSAEAKKQAALKKKREAEKKKKLAAEKKRKAEQAKKAEQKRKEEARKKKLAEEAEKKRKLEEQARRKREEEELKQKLAEEERLEREAREAAARAKVLDSLRSQYVRQIEQKVERNWLRPAGIATTSACEVYVTQSILGDVLDVKLASCQNDAAYQRSIERAVRRASPLPPPPDPGVFDKEIHFVFRPQN